MTEAIIILMNMRGGCATVGDKVHALFRVNNGRRPRKPDQQGSNIASDTATDQPADSFAGQEQAMNLS